jgi:hypothetical protein
MDYVTSASAFVIGGTGDIRPSYLLASTINVQGGGTINKR